MYRSRVLCDGYGTGTGVSVSISVTLVPVLTAQPFCALSDPPSLPQRGSGGSRSLAYELNNPFKPIHCPATRSMPTPRRATTPSTNATEETDINDINRESEHGTERLALAEAVERRESARWCDSMLSSTSVLVASRLGLVMFM